MNNRSDLRNSLINIS